MQTVLAGDMTILAARGISSPVVPAPDHLVKLGYVVEHLVGADDLNSDLVEIGRVQERFLQLCRPPMPSVSSMMPSIGLTAHTRYQRPLRGIQLHKGVRHATEGIMHEPPLET